MNNIVKSFTIVTGFSVVTRALSFIFKIWMSRTLGAETVGLYQICLSVLLLLFSLTAGAPTVLSRKVAAAVADGDTKRQNALTSASIALGLAVAVVLSVILFACNKHLGVLFADDRCVPIFLIMLPALLSSTLYAPLRSWFWGRKNFLAFSSTELLDEVFKIVFSVILAGGMIAATSGAIGVAIAFSLSDLLCVIILLVLFFARGGRLVKPSGIKEIATATVPLSAVRILSSLSISLIALIIPDRLIASGMSPSLATAEFGRIAGMALPLIMAPVTLISALSVVLIPDVASLAAKGDYAQIRVKLNASIVFAALVSALCFALYLPLGETLGKLLFNDAAAGKFVSTCSALIFPLGLSQVTTPMLNSLGMEKRTFATYIAGAVCLLPCIFILPTYIGVYAMAVGSGISFSVTALLNTAILAKQLSSRQCSLPDNADYPNSSKATPFDISDIRRANEDKKGLKERFKLKDSIAQSQHKIPQQKSTKPLPINQKKSDGLGSLKKSIITVLFSIPLGFLGLFTKRLLTPFLGDYLCAALTAFYLLFLFILFVSAFDIVDIKAYLVLLKPTHMLSRGNKTAKLTKKIARIKSSKSKRGFSHKQTRPAHTDRKRGESKAIV